MVYQKHFGDTPYTILVLQCFIIKNMCPIQVVFFDSFGESGTPAQLMEKYGLTAKDIVAAAKKAIARKQA